MRGGTATHTKRSSWMLKLERFVVPALLAAGLVLVSPVSHAKLKVGYTIKNVKIRDSNNNPAWIPDIGKKVLTIFYTDPDVKDQNEPFRDALWDAKLDLKIYRGIGVANLKDTWKPNFIIRSFVREKEKKFESLILTDVDHTLRNKWGLGDCNEKDVVIVVGLDKKVKYLKNGPMTAAEVKRVVKLVKDLMAEAKPGGDKPKPQGEKKK